MKRVRTAATGNRKLVGGIKIFIFLLLTYNQQKNYNC